MKKINLLMTLILSTNMVIAQSIENKNITEEMNIKTTNEKFDIERFNKNKNHKNDYIFFENGDSIFQSLSGSVYYERRYFKDSLYYDYKEYYLTGSLKQVNPRFIRDFRTGIWKQYDETGKLIKSIDCDKGFENCPIDSVCDFLVKEYNVDLNSNNYDIDRTFDKELKVRIYAIMLSDICRVIKINAETCKVYYNEKYIPIR